jgi:PNKP adenylyltransferase domain, ligase domain
VAVIAGCGGGGKKDLIQPALKVRGHEYLRIICGPEYDAPENLARLPERGLRGKGNLALREFASSPGQSRIRYQYRTIDVAENYRLSLIEKRPQGAVHRQPAFRCQV